MKKLQFKRDRSVELEITKSGWVKVKKNKKTLAHTTNFEAAREYIYKFLLDKKEFVSKDDFEEVQNV